MIAERQPAPERVDVSVVISTRNNARLLDRTLRGFRGLRLRPGTTWEMVLVNNGSTDQTGSIVRKWEVELPIRNINEPREGLSRGRNAGIAAARGALLVLTDDDVVVPPEWLTTYLDAYRAMGGRFYFGGPITADFEGPPPDPEWLPYAPPSVKGLDWGAHARPLEPGEFFIGPNWACEAECVRKVGGFDPQLGLGARGGPQGGEEIDLMNRLAKAGLRGWYLPEARLKHWVPAAKTTPTHIGARWQELATVTAWTQPSRFPGRAIAGVPWRILVRRVEAVVRRRLAAFGIGNEVEAVARLHWAVGLSRGCRLRSRPVGNSSDWRDPGDVTTSPAPD
jgi:GT2 family glycosyltransferase